MTGQTEASTVTDAADLTGQQRASGGASPTRMPDVVGLLGLVGVLVVATRRTIGELTDPDVWWHLRLGDDFRGGRPLSDPGQLGPFADSEWAPTQWLPEVLVSYVNEWFGLPAVAWVFSLGTTLVIGGVYILARRSAEPLPSAVVAAASFIAMSASLTPRPHMVTYVLLLLTLDGWLRTARDLRPRWWLVFVSWVWVMSHGMWFVGLLAGAAVLAGLLLDRRLSRAQWPLAMVLGLSGLVAFVTPAGMAVVWAPFAVNDVSTFIEEWAPPDFREPAPMLAAALVAVVIATWVRKGGLSWVHIALVAGAGAWILLAVRTVTIGVLFLVPVLAMTMQLWLRRPASRRLGRRELGALLVSTTVVLAVAGVLQSREARQPGDVPLALSAQLEDAASGTVVFNEYRLGGWLLWEHRHLKPVIDGLTESYSVGYISEYGRVLQARPGWDDLLASSGASVALIDEASALRAALDRDPGWVLTGNDTPYVLFVLEDTEGSDE